MINFEHEELIRKYQWAGKIRALSFFLLLLFLLLMKTIGGYSYLNSMFIGLVFVEAILNQPYSFIIKRVNIQRFQYLQMATDIIVISWVLYYMGGVEAPLVTIAYYAIILWAGVVSSTYAAFFAVTLSSLCYSAIVLFEHFGIFPHISYYEYSMPTEQMFSLLAGNVSFLFAFGYFTTRSSSIIKSLERKRQEESVRNVHKLTETGYLVENTVHDILNYLSSIRGYADVLVDESYPIKESEQKDILESIVRLERKSSELLMRLARFAQMQDHGTKAFYVTDVIEDAINLTWPILRYANLNMVKKYDQNMPQMMGERHQLQEVFVSIFLNIIDGLSDGDQINIFTQYDSEKKWVEIIIEDTGRGFSQQQLDLLKNSLFHEAESGKGLGVGLAVAYELVERQKGKMSVESHVGKGTRFSIGLPVMEPLDPDIRRASQKDLA